MTRMELPNTPGDFTIDGISIVILPNKIIVDTGNRQTAQSRGTQNQPAYTGKKKGNGSSGQSYNKKDTFNSILDNCQDIVMGKKRV